MQAAAPLAPPMFTNPFYVPQSEEESLMISQFEAQRFEPDYGLDEFSQAETRLYELIEFYRVWNPEVGAMLSNAYLILKNWE